MNDDLIFIIEAPVVDDDLSDVRLDVGGVVVDLVVGIGDDDVAG